MSVIVSLIIVASLVASGYYLVRRARRNRWKETPEQILHRLIEDYARMRRNTPRTGQSAKDWPMGWWNHQRVRKVNRA